MQDVSKNLFSFVTALEPLVDKTHSADSIATVFNENKGFESLEKMVKRLDNRFRYTLEVRESSWINNKVYNFLKERKISLTWSIKDELKTPHIVTSDQTYIKFIGDRIIDDKGFGKIVKNGDKEMIEYVDIVNKIQDDIKEQHTILLLLITILQVLVHSLLIRF